MRRILTLALIVLTACGEPVKEELTREEALAKLDNQLSTLQWSADDNSFDMDDTFWIVYHVEQFEDDYGPGEDVDDRWAQALDLVNDYYTSLFSEENPEERYKGLCYSSTYGPRLNRASDTIKLILRNSDHLSPVQKIAWENRGYMLATETPTVCALMDTFSVANHIWQTEGPREEIAQKLYELSLAEHTFCNMGCLRKDPNASGEPNTFACKQSGPIGNTHTWGKYAGVKEPEIYNALVSISEQCTISGSWTL